MTQEMWLLTGGAGYIGAHIADEFIRAGKSVVIYDSLYQGLEHRISYLRTKHNIDTPLIKADIRDYTKLKASSAITRLMASSIPQLSKQSVNPWKSQMNTLK